MTERQVEGIKRAQAEGKYKGRVPKSIPQTFRLKLFAMGRATLKRPWASEFFAFFSLKTSPDIILFAVRTYVLFLLLKMNCASAPAEWPQSFHLEVHLNQKFKALTHFYRSEVNLLPRVAHTFF
jgi:hypothetical protein